MKIVGREDIIIRIQKKVLMSHRGIWRKGFDWEEKWLREHTESRAWKGSSPCP